MMHRSLLTLSLLATSNCALVSSITNNQLPTITNHNQVNLDQQNVAATLQKVKLPLINNIPINSNYCYQIANNVFVYLQDQKVDDKIMSKIYYLDVSDVNNVITKEIGQTDNWLPKLRLTTVSLGAKKVIFYYPNYYQKANECLYLDLNDLSLPVVAKIAIPTMPHHRALIKAINYVDNNNIIVSTNDGVLAFDLTNIHHPHSFRWDTGDIYVSQFIQISTTKYLVYGVTSSETGIKRDFYIFDVVNSRYQPVITKIDLDLSGFPTLHLQQKLAADNFILSGGKKLYHLNLTSLAAPILRELNIDFREMYDKMAVIDDYNVVVTSVQGPEKAPHLWALKLINNRLEPTAITLPPITNPNLFASMIYLSNNEFIVRIIHDDFKITTYLLDLTNDKQPQWTNTGLGTDMNSWQPLKLSSSTVLLNDSQREAYIGILS